jgi:hypothetical protein
VVVAYLSSDPDVLWLRILKAKYFPLSSPLMCLPGSGTSVSQFWRQLLNVRDDFRGLVKFTVGNGESVRFWLDWWTGEGPLATSFPVLFSFVSVPSISIAELAGSGWDFSFRRVLSPVELEDWQRLVALLPVLSEA